MVHTAIVLPRELLDEVKAEASRNRHSVSAEIRTCLQLSYFLKATPYDPKTTGLLRCIQHLADKLASDLGMKWSEHPYALAAFKAGVAAFLAQYQPEGDANARPDTQVGGEHDDPPEAIGRTHARLILSARGSED